MTGSQFISCPGYVSNDRKSVIFTVTLPKPLGSDINHVVIRGLKLNIGTIDSKWIGHSFVQDGYNYAADAEFTCSVRLAKYNYISFVIDSSGYFKGLENPTISNTSIKWNNTPVTVRLSNFKLYFSDVSPTTFSLGLSSNESSEGE